jgi:hypothetical protein
MSVSNVSIANRALTYLAATRITDLEQDSEVARKVNAIYEDTRDALLSEHPWNFAKKQRALSLLDETPTVETWAYVFQLPSDCLRVLSTENDEPFEIFTGKKLYCNASAISITYIARITDPVQFSPGFVNAFSMRLGADLAFSITQNATLASGAEKKAEMALKEAKWSDAQEGQGISTVSGTFIQARQA